MSEAIQKAITEKVGRGVINYQGKKGVWQQGERKVLTDIVLRCGWKFLP